MSSSEKRAYCEFVNDLWKGDLDFLDIIPINTNNDDVYSVLDKGIILWYFFFLRIFSSLSAVVKMWKMKTVNWSIKLLIIR